MTGEPISPDKERSESPQAVDAPLHVAAFDGDNVDWGNPREHYPVGTMVMFNGVPHVVSEDNQLVELAPHVDFAQAEAQIPQAVLDEDDRLVDEMLAESDGDDIRVSSRPRTDEEIARLADAAGGEPHRVGVGVDVSVPDSVRRQLMSAGDEIRTTLAAAVSTQMLSDLDETIRNGDPVDGEATSEYTPPQGHVTLPTRRPAHHGIPLPYRGSTSSVPGTASWHFADGLREGEDADYELDSMCASVMDNGQLGIFRMTQAGWAVMQAIDIAEELAELGFGPDNSDSHTHTIRLTGSIEDLAADGGLLCPEQSQLFLEVLLRDVPWYNKKLSYHLKKFRKLTTASSGDSFTIAFSLAAYAVGIPWYFAFRFLDLTLWFG